MRPGTLVDRVRLAAEAGGEARVDDDELAEARGQLVELDRVVAARAAARRRPARPCSSPAVERPAPGVEVDHGAVVVAEVAQEPPEPLGAAERAVGDDEDVAARSRPSPQRGANSADAPDSGWRPPAPGGAREVRARRRGTSRRPGGWPPPPVASDAPSTVRKVVVVPPQRPVGEARVAPPHGQRSCGLVAAWNASGSAVESSARRDQRGGATMGMIESRAGRRRIRRRGATCCKPDREGGGRLRPPLVHRHRGAPEELRDHARASSRARSTTGWASTARRSPASTRSRSPTWSRSPTRRRSAILPSSEGEAEDRPHDLRRRQARRRALRGRPALRAAPRARADASRWASTRSTSAPSSSTSCFKDSDGHRDARRGRLLRDDGARRGDRPPLRDDQGARGGRDPDRVPPPRGRAVAARDRHALRPRARDGRLHDHLPADREGDRGQARRLRDLHAEAALRRERLGDAHAHVALQGRPQPVLRPGRRVPPVAGRRSSSSPACCTTRASSRPCSRSG